MSKKNVLIKGNVCVSGKIVGNITSNAEKPEARTVVINGDVSISGDLFIPDDLSVYATGNVACNK